MKVKSESEDAQSCLTLSDLMDCSLPGSSGAWDFLGKSTGVGCHCLLQHDGLGTYYIWQENWNNLLPPLPNFHLITTPCFCELYSLSLLRSTDFFSYTVCGVFSNFMILFLIFVKIKKLFLPFCLVKFIHHDLEEVFNVHSSSVQFIHSVVSDSLRPHVLQHARPPCQSPMPGVYPNSCPLSGWCHPTISSSVIAFFSHLQSFPASGS